MDNKPEILSVLIAGVGGQGTLFASRVLGNYACLNNLDCKLSEVHGMSQRGGSVVTHVKISVLPANEQVIFSPIISEGGADILLAFEKLEAQRWAHFLKPGGKIIVNTQEIMPLPVISGAVQYPADALIALAEKYPESVTVPALEIALNCGNPKALNSVMCGVLAKLAGLSLCGLISALQISVKEGLFDVNKKAMEAGYAFIN